MGFFFSQSMHIYDVGTAYIVLVYLLQLLEASVTNLLAHNLRTCMYYFFSVDSSHVILNINI